MKIEYQIGNSVREIIDEEFVLQKFDAVKTGGRAF